jgi:hypothetical protein
MHENYSLLKILFYTKAGLTNKNAYNTTGFILFLESFFKNSTEPSFEWNCRKHKGSPISEDNY